MDKERRQKLFDDYPKLFAKRNKAPNDCGRYPIVWGLEHGDGWLTLVEELCKLIQHHIDQQRQKNPDFAQVEVVQVKEKFGSLRFYTTECDEYITGLISMAESISGKTCEACGNPGTARKAGWLRVRCDPCEEIRNQKIQETENAGVNIPNPGSQG